MVFVFSGTGNSRYIAEKISVALNDPLYSLNDALKIGKPESVCSGNMVILVTPTYAWRIPRIVRDWLLRTELAGAEKIWFVMSCGDEIGNAAKYNRILAEEKHLRYMGTAQVIMPENYIAMFKTPSDQQASVIVEKAEPQLDRIIAALRGLEEFPIPRSNLYDQLMSSAVNTVFYPLFVKSDAFTSKDNCIGCGKCEVLCPLNNIKLADARPVWGKNCTHCMACISYCPVEAIEYGKHSVGLPRYHL